AVIGGARVVFTRAERNLLQVLTSRPGRVFSRAELLDALSGSGSGASDRSVDFAINRLRRKLGDDARAPRFVSTRYGEGYVWLAVPDPADALAACFIVIGPLHGAGGDTAGASMAFAEAVLRELDDKTDASR